MCRFAIKWQYFAVPFTVVHLDHRSQRGKGSGRLSMKLVWRSEKLCWHFRQKKAFLQMLLDRSSVSCFFQMKFSILRILLLFASPLHTNIEQDISAK